MWRRRSRAGDQRRGLSDLRRDRRRRPEPGVFSFSQTCPQCGGSGRIIPTPCTQCRGKGVEVRTRNIKVKIPAGVQDGATVRIPRKGNPGRNGGPPGDLLLKVHVTPHPIFERRGNDLHVTVPISFTEATLGTTVEVPTLEGSVNIKIPAGTPNGKVFRVRGKGVKPERGQPGDLYARAEVVVPRKVSREEKKLLEQLADINTEDPRAHLKVTQLSEKRIAGGLRDLGSRRAGGNAPPNPENLRTQRSDRSLPDPGRDPALQPGRHRAPHPHPIPHQPGTQSGRGQAGSGPPNEVQRLRADVAKLREAVEETRQAAKRQALEIHQSYRREIVLRSQLLPEMRKKTRPEGEDPRIVRQVVLPIRQKPASEPLGTV